MIDGQISVIDTPDALRRRYGKREVELEWEGASDSDDETERFPLDGLADNLAFLDGLRRGGLKAIHSQEATLEDVFLQVTGRSLK